MRPLPATMRDQEVFEPLGPPIRALEPLTQAEGKVFEDAMFEGSDWDAMAPNAVYDRHHGWVHKDFVKAPQARAKRLGGNVVKDVIHIGDAAFEAAFPSMVTNEGDSIRRGQVGEINRLVIREDDLPFAVANEGDNLGAVFNRAQASALNHLIAKEDAHLLASTNTWHVMKRGADWGAFIDPGNP